MAKAILNFEKKGIKKLHFFAGGISFPVVAAAYSDWDNEQLSYLKRNFQRGGFTTKNVCEWCIHHQIDYRIFYPVSIGYILKHPYKFILYLQLKKELGYSF